MPPRQDAASTSESAMPPRVQTSATEEVKVLKNRPKASKLRQQKLPAWQPILTAYTAIPVVFAIGFIFIPIGVVVLLSAKSVQEIDLEYGKLCTNLKSNCTLNIDVKKSFEGNVYFYYGLENYFQNHRRYVKSRSDSQLLGDLENVGTDCEPLAKGKDTDGKEKKIAPCGAIANSMFNDTFKLFDSSGKKVPFTIDGVIWDVDRRVKFKNPSPKDGGNLCSAFDGYMKPPNWATHPCNLTNDPKNNGFENVDFIVWMRTAALPSFKKLYRLLDRKHDSTYSDGLPAGQYQLVIENNYPVDAFNGKKHFIISTTSWTGGKNNFLGIAYIIIGCICVILGAIFSFIHIKFGHSFAEMANISSSAAH